MVQLAFVLITRNQAWNVDRLLRSIFNEPASDEAWEIVLVDSASTDATIDLAQIHPITILQLDSTERLTAAAGRLVGYWHTTAEHVMFLDGDMELLSGWIPDALEILAQDRTVGVVANTLIDVPIQGEGGDVAPVALSSGAPEFDEAPHGGGAALYRRAALREAGSWNPHLTSDEEPELCLRIRAFGYRVVRSAPPGAYHYSDARDSLSTILRRRRAGLYLGWGQICRSYLGTPYLLPYVAERSFVPTPLAAIALGLAAGITSLLTSDITWFASWLALVALGVALVALRRRSIRGALVWVATRLGHNRGRVARPNLAGQEPSALRGDLDGRQAAGSWPAVAPRRRRRLPSPRRRKRAQPAPAGSPPPRCGGSASL